MTSTPEQAATNPRAVLNRLGAMGAETESIVFRLVIFVVMCVTLWAVSESFLTQSNIINILRQASLIYILAIGLTLVVITGGIDLSVGTTLTLCACLTAGVIKATGLVWMGVAVGIGVGAIVGLTNGVLVSILRLPPFLATFATMWICQGLAFHYMSGSVIYGFPDTFRELGVGFVGPLPIPVLILFALLIVVTIVLRNTTFGHELYAIGSNQRAAAFSGLNVRKRLLYVYSMCGMTAGFAGVVYLARVNAADAGVGEPLLLPTLAAVLIGGASLFGGKGNAVGTMIGTLMLTLVLNGMNLLAINANFQPLAAGVMVLIAVGADAIINRRSG